MITRAQTRKANPQEQVAGEKTRSVSSASSATTIARFKEAEAARKMQLAEIAKREATAVAAAEREAAEATFEANIAALEVEEALSARSSRTADWIQKTNFAEMADDVAAPDGSLLREHSMAQHIAHAAPGTELVRDVMQRSPAAIAKVAIAMSPRQLRPTSDLPPQPSCPGNVTVPRVSDIEKLANAIIASLPKPNQNQSRCQIKLTEFSGNITDWLLFKRTFDDTKNNYTASENIDRLRKALSGEAKDSVLSLLLCSAKPELIMQSLESRFARPKQIVLNELASVRSLPKVGREPNALAIFASKVKNCLSIVNLLGESPYIQSPELIHILVSKMNPLLQNKWCDYAAEHCVSGHPQIEVFARFLEVEADKQANFGLCEVFNCPSYSDKPRQQASQPAGVHQRSNPRPNRISQTHHTDTFSSADSSAHPTVNLVSSSNAKPPLSCLYCSANNHNVKSCPEFAALKITDRVSWVSDNKLCVKCLRKGKHSYKFCKAKPCGVDGCKEFHNKILHLANNPLFLSHPNVNNVMSSVNSEPSTSHVINDNHKKETQLDRDRKGFISSNEFSSNKDIITNTSYSCASNNEQSVFLKVIPVILSGPKGEVETFALLDDGSTATLLDSELADQLGVSGTDENMRIETITGISDSIPVRFVDFQIRGKHEKEKYFIRKARAIPNLKLRPQEVTVRDTSFQHLQGISAELVFSMATPKLLIGTSDWHLLLSKENRVGTARQPAACRTALGWVLFGNLTPNSLSDVSINHIVTNDSRDIELDSLIRDYYRLDSIGIRPEDKVNSEDAKAISILDKTTRRLDNGRFEVGLPWREDEPHIPDSYYLALSRFRSLCKRFDKDKEYERLYKLNIEAQVQKGYAEECVDGHDNPSSSSRRWYLPHFGVINPNKPGKLRIVHDASARSSDVSLNSLILPGPDRLQSLFGILMRFREGQVALNGDIREMFPQIRIREDDRDCQRYIWFSPDGHLKEFRMSSLIFGASASPFIAIYIKNRNAMDFQDRYPEAARSIIRDHYMDDFLASCDSLEDAIRLAGDVLHVHSQCGFEMRSWVSNAPESLKLIPSHLRKEDTSNVDLNLSGTQSKPDVRVLGMHWNPQDDTFSFKIDVDIPLPAKLTKRRILRDLMRIYDPLGLLQPTITKGKILFQRTWQLVNSWDVPLPNCEYEQWVEWYNDVKTLNAFSVPRAYKPSFTFVTQELHIFTDASEVAYACVAYHRFLFPDGTIHLALIASKSRVAPLKPVSIPRLELQAALLGVRLAQTICNELRNQPSRRFFWCDSKTVLAWIRSDSRKYKAFVSHRLGEISELTQVNEWRWVPTDLNVADDATRLNTVSVERWSHGPTFLKHRADTWPQEVDQIIPPEVELRSKKRTAYINFISLSAERFSDWRRLLRVAARVYQFIRLLRRRDARTADAFCGGLRPLLALDVKNAEIYLLGQSQRDSFGEEIECLRQGKNISRKSRLCKLTPRFCDDGLLRARGRISSVTGVTSDIKEPIILDGRHPTVKLLIARYHVWALHGNSETVVNELRQKYAILHLRPSVRFIAARCRICRLKKAKAHIPPTGDLPIERLQHHHPPFSFVGLDYLGPIDVAVKRSREKRYVALFTCLVIRAIHLEVVASLTADSAIMALRRFIARRGCPTKIISDNGTAFVGANRLLKEAWDALDHSQLQEFAASNNIEWQFIPPGAPFMGGAWERLVRSVKVGLSVTLREKAPRDEILLTLLAEIEQVINSRPLTHVPVAHEDEPALTPNHFLLGIHSTLPSPASSDADLSSRQGWLKANRLADQFWSRWLREYLPNLLPRGPSLEHHNLQIGDVVLVGDTNFPRGIWPRGRIVQVFPGRDGIVRVADVRTSAGVLRRPARKLVKLDLSP